MPTESVNLRPFRGDAYQEVGIVEEVDVTPSGPIVVRPYRKDAYHEIALEKEVIKNADDYVKIFSAKARIILNTISHYTGLIILIAIIMASLFIVIRGDYPSEQIDNANKLIILVVGAILGTLFPTSKKDD